MDQLNRFEILIDLIDKYIDKINPTEDDEQLNKQRDDNVQLLTQVLFYVEFKLHQVAELTKNNNHSHDIIIHRARTTLQLIYDTLNETTSFPITKTIPVPDNVFKITIWWKDYAKREFIFTKVYRTWISENAMYDGTTYEDWVIKNCPDVDAVLNRMIKEDSNITKITVHTCPPEFSEYITTAYVGPNE